MATVKMMPFIVQPFILFLLALPLLRKKGFPILKTHTCVQSHQALAFLTSSLQHPPNLRTPPPSPSPFQVYDFFYFITQRVQLSLYICAWWWGHPLQPGQPARRNSKRKVTLPPSAVFER